MAIVKATYTKSTHGAKAAIRYISHRPGRDGQKVVRTLFGSDGALSRDQAYALVDAAAPGTVFFRFAISPDPAREDTHRDLPLREMTEHTMQELEHRLGKPLAYVAAEHTDHAPHRHVHVVACVVGRLNTQDFQAMRTAATAACQLQRQARDLARDQQVQEQEEQWEL